jgi:hypothetical protein
MFVGIAFVAFIALLGLIIYACVEWVRGKLRARRTGTQQAGEPK